ncbi:MAG: hypothetical protein HQL18_02100 [Candidatus Omnitrophica bacterium]|nr:hypothetical protein [Candidatus Omnitrophota bacterium]
MKQIRSIVLAVLLAGLASFAWAGEEEMSSQGLDVTLTGLKESVARLNSENKKISAVNAARRAQVKPLLAKLSALKAEGDRLAMQVKVVDEQPQKKVENLQPLQEKLSVVKLSFDQARRTGETAEADLAARMKEDADLQSQIDQLQKSIRGMKAGWTMANLAATKEDRDRLQQDVRSAAEELSKTKEEWQAAKKASEGGERLQAVLKDQQTLREAIKNRNAELINVRQRVAEQQELAQQAEVKGVSPQILAQLEKDVADSSVAVKSLEKELSTAQANSVRHARTKAVRFENEENQYHELQARAKRRKAELDALRRQMIFLDKKKSSLEREIYKPKF